MAKLKHGDRVFVVNSLLYTGRVGTLVKNSGLEDDPWDFNVELEPRNGASARAEGGVIGVHDFQVLRTKFAAMRPVELNELIEALNHEGLILAADMLLVGLEESFIGATFIEAKMKLQAAVKKLSELDRSFDEFFKASLRLGMDGTLRNYVSYADSLRSHLNLYL